MEISKKTAYLSKEIAKRYQLKIPGGKLTQKRVISR